MGDLVDFPVGRKPRRSLPLEHRPITSLVGRKPKRQTMANWNELPAVVFSNGYTRYFVDWERTDSPTKDDDG